MMMRTQQLFEVWTSRGAGMSRGPRFGKLNDALRYVGTHIDEASFAIRLPTGGWFYNTDGKIIFPRMG